MILRSRVQLVLMFVLTIAVALPLTVHAGPMVNSVSSATKALDATPVSISDAIVTATFADGDGFAIQEANQSAGMRVISDTSVAPGNKVCVEGTIDTLGSERVILATKVNDYGTADAPILPLEIQCSDIGRNDEDLLGATLNNPYVPEGEAGRLFVGASNVGLLVLIRGQVTAVNNTGDSDGCFYVNDGGSVSDVFGNAFVCGVNDGSSSLGIRCRPVVDKNGAATMPAVGDFVVVTGVVGVMQAGDDNIRYIWTKSFEQATFAKFEIQVEEGWNLISLPAQPKNSDPSVVFSGFEVDCMLYGWDAVTQGLLGFDIWCPEGFGTIKSSEGFWFIADHAGTVSFTGYADNPSLERWISVPAGYRIIGTPAYDTNWLNWKVTDGSRIMTMTEAVADGYLDWNFIGLKSGAGFDISEDDYDNHESGGILKAGKGYWVKANENIALLAP